MKYHLSFDIDFKRNPYKGKFIAIEGIDGSGKTTQANTVVEKLKASGYNATYTKEPTDEPTGKFIREVLSGKIKVPPISLQYMYGADRAVHLDKIERELKEGAMVVTDRYFWSSVAYAISDLNSKNGDYYLTAFSILSHYHQFIIPDYTFFLKVSIETAVSRIEKSGKQKEIYDHRGKLQKIVKGYEWLLQRFPEEISIIDGEKSVEQVTDNIIAKI